MLAPATEKARILDTLKSGRPEAEQKVGEYDRTISDPRTRAEFDEFKRLRSAYVKVQDLVLETSAAGKSVDAINSCSLS